MQPDVSVIIPAFDSAATLGACLAAVRAQHVPVAEVIVVDDASTDATREIARAFGATIVEQPENRGPAAARNAGIRASRGEVLFFLDADCAPEPDALGVALAILRDEPDVACVHGIYSLQPLFDDGPVEAYRLLHGHYWRLKHAGRVRTTLFAVCAIRRSVFDEVGGFDERLRASEDVEIGDRMPARLGIVLSPAMVCRHDDDSRLGALLRKQFSRSQLLLPVAIHERGPVGVRANTPATVALAALTAATLPLALFGPPFAAVPMVVYAGFTVADPGLIRFVLRRRGPAFAAYFFAVHLLVQWAVIAGGLVGAVRHLRGTGPLATSTDSRVRSTDSRGRSTSWRGPSTDSHGGSTGSHEGSTGSRGAGAGSDGVSTDSRGPDAGSHGVGADSRRGAGNGSLAEGVGPFAESGR